MSKSPTRHWPTAAWATPAKSIAKQCTSRNGSNGLWGKRPLNQPYGYGHVNAGFANPKKSEATTVGAGAASVLQNEKV